MPSPSSLLTALLTATTLLSGGLLSGETALAQTSNQPYGTSLRRQSATEYAVLYVNPLSGDDQLGDGTRYQPFKTISQALQAAQTGTVILLAPGHYTTANGESFPLRLRPGISLQGQPTTTQSVFIQGGGSFNSDQLSNQSATILMADRSGLAYVVVSNPTPQGHGVWIESGQPIIRSSALVASEHTGLYVAGGTPTIEGSYFAQNRVAGLVLYGQAQAVVRGNQFENTGTAITVAEDAYAEITDNRILRNDEGVVLLGNASPLIANNQIEQNRRNGVVEVALVSPTTATVTPAPLLASRPSGQPSAEAAADRQNPLVARASGTPPLASTQTNVTPPSDPIAVSSPRPNRLTSSTPDETATAALSADTTVISAETATPSRQSPSTVRIRPRPTAPEPAAALPAPESVPASASISTTQAASTEPEAEAVPTSPSIADLRNRVAQRQSTLARLSNSENSEPEATTTSVSVPPVASAIGSGSVEIAVIPAESSSRRRISPPTTAPARETTSTAPTIPRNSNPGNRLSVPSSNIPVGSGGSSQFSPPANGASGPPAPPSRASAMGLTYRVFVAPHNEADRDRIRQIVPDAFRTRLNGQSLMQVGAYADEPTAQARRQLLLDNGFDARVEYLP